MYLSLQIISPNGAALGPNINKVFGEAGGTIGRAQGNDWVLPDPDRFISSRHAIVRCMGGMYSLEDVSVNGVFMNDQTTPVGAGSDPVILQNGDRIQIGDYQVQVSIVEEAPAGMDVGQRIDPLTTSPTGPITSPTTTPTGGASTIGPVDPLDLLGDADNWPGRSARSARRSSAGTCRAGGPAVVSGSLRSDQRLFCAARTGRWGYTR
jgi:type VI secretion system FHA domain protein